MKKRNIFILIFALIILTFIIVIYLRKDDNESNNIEVVKPKYDIVYEKNNLVSYNGWLKIKDNTLVNEKNEKIQLKGMSTHGL